ncbi:MAG: LysR family transcriptional regulator [Alphaproteobacteria bacterium]|nr:LysR family transcriptional regulator [Alphaproteobacteria bacterium]
MHLPPSSGMKTSSGSKRGPVQRLIKVNSDEREYVGKMIDVDTKLFRTFLTVAAERSFSVGARRMGYSQATMSLRIQALEEKLGVRLLERGPRDVRLTAAGRSLLPEIQALVDMHDRMVKRSKETPAFATVRVGIADSCGASLLPGLMNDILDDRSGAQLDILRRRSGCLQQMIEARRLDLAVVVLPGDSPAGFELGALKLRWVASPGFMPVPGMPVPVAWSGPDCPFRAMGVAALESSGVAYREVLPDPDEQVGQAALAAGTAVTVMAEGTVPEAMHVLPPDSGLPALHRASVRLLESAGMQSEATASVKRRIVDACLGAGAQAPPRA